MYLPFLITLLFAIGIVVLLWIDQLQHKRLLLAVLFLLYLSFNIASTLKKDMYVNFHYKQTTCLITSANVNVVQYSKSTLYYPTFYASYAANNANYNNEIKLNITDFGTLSYNTAATTTQIYSPGKNYICWYDPQNPLAVVLEKAWYTGVDDWKYTLMAGMLFIIILLIVFFNFS